MIELQFHDRALAEDLYNLHRAIRDINPAAAELNFGCRYSQLLAAIIQGVGAAIRPCNYRDRYTDAAGRCQFVVMPGMLTKLDRDQMAQLLATVR